MDSRSAASELLQNRLRDHQTEAARAQRARVNASRRSAVTREDHMTDDGDASSATSSSRLHNGAFVGPSAWRFNERESSASNAAASSSRRGSGAGISTPSDSKSMGARELEDHVNKLSKENFDLKLEIFHRRQKLEKLEQELDRVPTLEADHADLLSLNEDLVKELELRDRAVDEAVVRIHDLELYTNALERRLADLTLKAAMKQAAAPSDTSTSPNHANGSQGARNAQTARAGVSPQVSSRLAELALPLSSPGDRRSMPAFLSEKDASTAALRKMFVEGDRVTRPIPSRATLLEEPYGDDDGDEEAGQNGDPHDVLRSPRLSEMDENDYRTIAAASPEPTRREKLDDSPTLLRDLESPSKSSARVNRWVADRAMTSTYPESDERPPHPTQSDFQSFEQALQREPPARPAHVAVNLLQPRARRNKESQTPPLSAGAVFGPNVFPPTPDTMTTRQSNNSSSSLDPYRNHSRDSARNVSRSQSQRSPHPGPEMFGMRRLKDQPSVPSSLLPQEFDVYGEGLTSPTVDGGFDVSPPRGRNYRSDSSEESPETPRRKPFKGGSVGGSTMIDVEGLSGPMSAVRNATSPPRSFDSRRRPFDTKQYHLTPNAAPLLDNVATIEVDARTISSRSTHSGRKSNTSLAPSPPHDIHSHARNVESAVQFVMSGTPSSPLLSPSSLQGSGPRSSRASALRQRFNKFARRASGGANGLESPRPLSDRKRSTSITQRFGLRRNSSVSQNVSSMPMTQDGPNSAAPFVAPTALNDAALEQAAPLPPRRARSERVPARRSISQDPAPPAYGPGTIGLAMSGDPQLSTADSAASVRSTRAHSTSKTGTTTPLAHRATIALASRGRDAAPVSLRASKGLVRSLSRPRA